MKDLLGIQRKANSLQMITTSGTLLGMLRLDEIAEGISMALVSLPGPKPFRISLRNQGVIETTVLVRAVIDSCERRGSPIRGVHVCRELGSDLVKQYGHASGYQGVKIESSPELNSEIHFCRFPIPSKNSRQVD